MSSRRTRCQNLPPLLFLKKRQRQRKMRHRQVLKDRARHPHKAVKIWRRFRQKIQAMAVRQQRIIPKMKTRWHKMICRKMPPVQIVRHRITPRIRICLPEIWKIKQRMPGNRLSRQTNRIWQMRRTECRGTIRRQAGKMPAIRLPKVQIKPETIKPPVLQIPSPRQTLPLRIAAAILEGLIWLMASSLTAVRKM